MDRLQYTRDLSRARAPPGSLGDGPGRVGAGAGHGRTRGAGPGHLGAHAERSRRTVPIGRLDEVLARAAPGGDASPGSVAGALARGTLRVWLAEGALPPDADPGLPIGPGELVRVHEGAREPAC